MHTILAASRPSIKMTWPDAYVAVPMEEMIFKQLAHYARLFTSEDAELSHIGREKLRELACIFAKRENAHLFGHILNKKKQVLLEADKTAYNLFLDDQRGIANTKKLASLLQDRFGINSFRSCEDTVRAWKRTQKNLRSAMPT